MESKTKASKGRAATKPVSRADVLSRDDHERRQEPVPEWGGHVWVRTMSGAERDKFDEVRVRALDSLGDANLRAWLVALTVCDESGARLFADEDVPALSAKNGRVLDRLWDVADELNAVTPSAIEAAAKNSNGDRKDASGSNSPAT